MSKNKVNYLEVVCNESTEDTGRGERKIWGLQSANLVNRIVCADDEVAKSETRSTGPW